ncbi:MAG TPA: hypothetical protein ENF37_04510 [Beggiatoa sp.]|nr:hypothetical protein [Beggiatoa sp.]
MVTLLPSVFILLFIIPFYRLSNGKTTWTAAQDISELIEEVPGGLEKYRPHLRYTPLEKFCPW